MYEAPLAPARYPVTLLKVEHSEENDFLLHSIFVYVFFLFQPFFAEQFSNIYNPQKQLCLQSSYIKIV